VIRRPTAWDIFLVVAGGALLLFLVLPLAGLIGSTVGSTFSTGIRNPMVWPAVKLSLLTTLISLVCVTVPGTALAWMLVSRPGRVSRAVESLFQLPVVIPPAVAGVAMLVVFGRRGLLGPSLSGIGIELPFTTAAVVLAETFVSAPFYLHAAIAAFRRVDPDLLVVSRTLGASRAATFARLALPLSLPGLLGGAALSWARSLGEFGATLMFAGNLTGRTQTLPLAIYTVLETDLGAAQALSLLMVAGAFLLLVLLRSVSRS
jgi:molybdate transport system permease protein